MAETQNFDKLFASMTPLRHYHGSRDDKKDGRPLFQIKIKDGVPFLCLADLGIERSDLSSRDAKIYDSIMRKNKEPEYLPKTNMLRGYSGVSFYDDPMLPHLIDHADSILTPDSKSLKFSDMPASLTLDIKAAIATPAEEEEKGKPRIDSNADIALHLHADDADSTDVVFLDDTMVLCGDTVYKIPSVGDNFASISSLIQPIGGDVLEAFLTLFVTYFDNITLIFNGYKAYRSKIAEHTVPTLFLEKVASDKALYLRVGISIESLDGTLPPGFTPTATVNLNTDGTITIRNVEGCNISEHQENLRKMILESAPDRNAKKEIYEEGNFFIVPEETAGPFLLKRLPMVLEEFRLVGSEKLREYKVTAAAPKLNLRFSSGIDFLEGEGDVIIGDESFSITDILSQYAKKRYISLSDGNRAIIDENYISRLQRLFRNRDKQGHFKVTLFDLPEVEDLIKSKISGKFAARSREVLEGFNKLKRSRRPAYKVKAKLRPYQVEGVKWLKYLYDNKLGGCLADDMGLGKTLQTIALLSMIYPKCDKPSLIVMPRSLLFNWEKELDRFAPTITHSTYYGPERSLEESLKANVILTTYAIARNDAIKLKDLEFETIVLDESQNIKNVSAQTTVAIQLLRSSHRFALSGTPMENNLTELYSLFCFLNPTMFGSLEDFNSAYTTPIQKFGDKDASDSLRRKIFPFILRRLKKDVLDDLPDRIDQTIYVEMSEKQKQLYNSRRLSYRQQINETIAKEGVQKSQFLMFQALNELRRIASVPESVSDGKVSSPKIDELIESVISSVSNGHKTVVFFNFIAGIEIVMQRLEHLGIEFETMTGSTSASQRKKIVERFQSDPSCMVILMTLKVGGVGLNLTAADTVYIVEPWWNKAAEEQAINRLHRIGQKSTVSAFSIITVGTIEEKILQLQEQKSQLFNDLISADTASSKHLSESDIDFILS